MTAAVRQQPAAVSRLTGPFSRAALVPHVPIKFFSDYTYTYVQGRHLFLPIYILGGLRTFCRKVLIGNGPE